MEKIRLLLLKINDETTFRRALESWPVDLYYSWISDINVAISSSKIDEYLCTRSVMTPSFNLFQTIPEVIQ